MEWQDWARGFFQKEKYPWEHFGEFSCSSSSSLISTHLPGIPVELWGGYEAQILSMGWGTCTSEGPETTGTDMGEYNSERPENPGRLHTHTHRWVPEPVGMGTARKLGQRLPECWSSWRRAGLGSLSWLQPKKDQQNWLGQFEASRLVGFFWFLFLFVFCFCFSLK